MSRAIVDLIKALRVLRFARTVQEANIRRRLRPRTATHAFAAPNNPMHCLAALMRTHANAILVCGKLIVSHAVVWKFVMLRACMISIPLLRKQSKIDTGCLAVAVIVAVAVLLFGVCRFCSRLLVLSLCLSPPARQSVSLLWPLSSSMPPCRSICRLTFSLCLSGCLRHIVLT